MTTKTKALNVLTFKLNAVQRAFVSEVARLGNLMDAVSMQRDTVKAAARKITARTPEGMATIGQGILKLFTGKAFVTPENGIKFTNTQAQSWFENNVMGLLPAARKSNGKVKAKRMTAEQRDEAEVRACENSVVRLARRIRMARDEQGLTPRQIKEALRLGLGRAEL
jgi:hypothetical protein